MNYNKEIEKVQELDDLLALCESRQWGQSADCQVNRAVSAKVHAAMESIDSAALLRMADEAEARMRLLEPFWDALRAYQRAGGPGLTSQQWEKLDHAVDCAINAHHGFSGIAQGLRYIATKGLQGEPYDIVACCKLVWGGAPH